MENKDNTINLLIEKTNKDEVNTLLKEREYFVKSLFIKWKVLCYFII